MGISIEEFGEFLASPPPRVIPPAVKKKAMKSTMSPGYFIGLMFLGIGGVLAGVFFPWNLGDALALDFGKPTVAEGLVMRAVKTSMSENSVTIYKYEFTFTPVGGGEISGVCYSRGRKRRSGRRVIVEYLRDSPDVCRIKGCRLDPFGYWAGFTAIFPLVGFLITFFTWRGRRRKARLLSYGAFALGSIESVQRTAVRVNNQQQFKITVSFNANGGPRQITYKAYGGEVRLAKSKMHSGEKVGLLYDPNRPKRMLLANTLIE